MKLSEEIILERNRITGSFTTHPQYTGLLATDITDHAAQLKIVYKERIYNACELDNCLRRFENVFRWN